MKLSIITIISIALSSFSLAAESLQQLYHQPAPAPQEVTIFTAKEVITMSDHLTTATAIAVKEGKIIDIGGSDELKERFKESKGLVVDDTFAQKVITPGFIDPHLHFWLFALVSNAHFITPADWQLPWGDVKGVVGEEAYLKRLKEVEATLKDPNEMLLTWGYHSSFHGKLNRKILDNISKTRPIIVWQRSVHEFYFNTKALEFLEQTEEGWKSKGDASKMMNWETGHIWEKGVFALLPKLFPAIGSPEKFELGLERARSYIHAGGITAASDPGVQLTEDMIRQMISVLESGEMPFNYYLIPAGNTIYDLNDKDGEKAVAMVRDMTSRLNGKHVKWEKDQIKLFTDGAVYSQLMQMQEGYLDGHDGEWIQYPEEFADSAWAFWNEGYQLIVHQNGDEGLELALNTLEGLLHRKPRYDHRFGIHHFAFSKKPQIKRAAKLGANISSNPFYIHVLGEQYSKVGVGPERAEVMARGRSVLDEKVKLSFHSDSPMAPARPMLLAWAAVNRIGLSGEKVLGSEEKVTVTEALRAITIDAAYAIQKENQMGSIEIGKQANFTVFDENPLEADPTKLKDMKIWGTVFEGEVYPIKQQAKGMVMSEKTQQKLSTFHTTESHNHYHGDACSTNQMLQAAAVALAHNKK